MLIDGFPASVSLAPFRQELRALTLAPFSPLLRGPEFQTVILDKMQST